MPDWSRVDRSHVLAAIEECNRLGSREFLSRYGFGRARVSQLWFRGEEYDPKAILGVAYLTATGVPPAREEYRGDENGAVRVLSGLGFDVVVDEQAAAAAERTARPAARTRAEPAPAPAAGPGHGANAAGAAAHAPQAPAKRAATTRRKTPARVAKPAPEVRLCPRCYVAVPASGICDFCD